MTYLNLDDAPSDSIERLKWLEQAEREARREVEQAYREAYFHARLEGRLNAAAWLGMHSMTRILRFTREHNNSLRRMVRWDDGLDSRSSAYRG